MLNAATIAMICSNLASLSRGESAMSLLALWYKVEEKESTWYIDKERCFTEIKVDFQKFQAST